jgi:hypothetical protein
VPSFSVRHRSTAAWCGVDEDRAVQSRHYTLSGKATFMVKILYREIIIFLLVGRDTVGMILIHQTMSRNQMRMMAENPNRVPGRSPR